MHGFRSRAAAAMMLAFGLVVIPSGGVGRRVPIVDWTRLTNPILGYGDRSVKDPAVVFAGGRWHALFSLIDGRGTWRIAITRSRDLRRWSRLAAVPHDPAVEGEASPDVVRAPDGHFVVTYQSFVHDIHGGEAKLYYRTTNDFRRFSPAHPLGRGLHPAPADRMIDAALAWTSAGLLIAYKYGATEGPQAFELARSTTGSLDGPWVPVGRPSLTVYGDTIENYQFLHLNGRWQLLATSNNLDRPFLFDLTGDPHQAQGWLSWSPGRELQIPQESWNPGSGTTGATYEHANSAFLVDRGSIQGRYYLVYADAPDRTSFGGQGHNQLGIARSTDLINWSVPPA